MGQLKDYLFYRDDWATIYCGDCLEIMPLMESESVDLVVTDPPYGITQNEWDIAVNFIEFWKNIKKLCSGQTILTAAQPFTTDVINSNRNEFRYEIIWDKVNKYSNYLNANKMPLRRHENIIIFGSLNLIFNPQKSKHPYPYKTRRTKSGTPRHYGTGTTTDSGRFVDELWPCSIIQFPSNTTTGILHPSQKPVDLFVYLISSYSNLQNLVLDPFLGSGTTCVAAKNLNRKSIGIEINPKYCEIAVKRLR